MHDDKYAVEPYISMAKIYSKRGHMDLYEQVLNYGRQRFPNDYVFDSLLRKYNFTPSQYKGRTRIETLTIVSADMCVHFFVCVGNG